MLARNDPPNTGLAHMSQVSIDLLRTFFELAQLKSYTACSKKLNLSQPAISNRIKRLEDTVQFSLFIERNPHRGMTEQAQQLYQITQRIVGELEKIEGLIGNTSCARFRIGVLPAVEFFFGPEMIWKLDTPGTGPKLEIVTDSEDNLVKKVSLGQIEVAVVCSREGKPPNSVFSKRCTLNWICGLQFDENTLANDAEVPVVIWRGNVSRGPSADEILQRSNRAHQVVFETSSLTSYFDAIRRGYGVGFTVDSFLRANRNPYSVKMLDKHLPELGRIDFHVVCDPNSPACVRKLAKQLASVFEEA
ncbi:LysR family transcriptional regulator (plasmid) [Leisingera sp. M527]|uniref:LysR family transcriptional regulator n=1 Tax=Leisingera sp. M527 TaxID=2867014 RepID=UPI0021A888AF|nr:LysR family transcriptional regulator [Leisingera sp. M527]UWQ35670.1 LysR family transcriptional regulator [Leisingera sp. M527]